MPTMTSLISNQPERYGGDACIHDTRTTIWGLEAYRRLGMTDAQILVSAPDRKGDRQGRMRHGRHRLQRPLRPRLHPQSETARRHRKKRKTAKR
nr:hypothetical protein [uncultured bacterium]